VLGIALENLHEASNTNANDAEESVVVGDFGDGFTSGCEQF